jgi:hypothetical protein
LRRCRQAMGNGPLAPSEDPMSGAIDKQAKQVGRDDTTICVSPLHSRLRPILDATALPTRPVMPPRLRLGAPRATIPSIPPRICIRLHRRFASSSTDEPEVYDVVCVGGGPAGLSLLAGLKASPVTSGLKVALIEGQDLQKNRLPQDASLESFSNRCSSLTPASVKNLRGT